MCLVLGWAKAVTQAEASIGTEAGVVVLFSWAMALVGVRAQVCSSGLGQVCSWEVGPG